MLWRQCGPATEDTEAAQWLRDRALDAALVEDRDLARVIPRGAALPPWARSGARAWSETGHRLIVPMRDSRGQIVSLHARALGSAEPKSLWPKGCRAEGVLADPLARMLLATGQAPDWWADRAIIIAEGVPDFLTWATRYGDDESAPAVLGVAAGSWTSEIARRIPDGCRVLVRTHHDGAGHRYAAVVATSLRRRCDVRVPVSS